jgi:hypothetical protein
MSTGVANSLSVGFWTTTGERIAMIAPKPQTPFSNFYILVKQPDKQDSNMMMSRF